MRLRPSKPFYSQAPIQSLDDLARVVGLSRCVLERLAARADSQYRPVPQRKKDGTRRETWAANRKLKRVHTLIKTRILDHVVFPRYLYGGIRDRQSPRDYAQHAARHVGRAVIVSEDIADFFPSTSALRVKRIWTEVFRFPPDVAECLTRLTTRRGFLPQGARTSNHLAYLVFFDQEYHLEEHLRKQGLRYTRFADDITVSSRRSLTNRTKTKVIASVYGLMQRAGYRPKRRKHAIHVNGASMRVHSLVVNEHVALPRAERYAIRAEVHRHLQQSEEVRAMQLAHVRGRVGKLRRFHPEKANRLRERLQRTQ